MIDLRIFSSKYVLVIIILIFVTFFNKTVTADESLAKDVRTFISLMDYIGTDYTNAVGNGEIKNTGEFAEMNEFINESIGLFKGFSSRLNSNDRILAENKLQELKHLIEGKADDALVFKKAGEIKQLILKENIIAISPKLWPSISDGEKIFKENCISCHGPSGKGDGILAVNLNPRPANLQNDTLMKAVSPFQIYNTIRLGIRGTAMPLFDKLTDKDVWDAAFYVSTLRYNKKDILPEDSLLSLQNKAITIISLDELSTSSDKVLSEKYSSVNKNIPLYLRALRLYEAKGNNGLSISKAFRLLDEVISSYRAGDYEKASEKALSAYLEGIEPYEQQIQIIDPGLKNDLESIMFKLRSDINNQKSFEIIKEDTDKSKALINEAISALGNKKYSFWFAFLLAASIILREGIEAFLIIITILGVLRSVDASKAAKWVHTGWITALAVAALSFFFTGLILSFGAQNRELMEGVGSVIAVAVLLYVGFWLHSKTEAKKWKEFVEIKILRLVSGNNMIGLALISFIVVFREAFESIIFISAINLEVEPSGSSGVYLGVLFSLVFVLILSWIAVRFSKRLPVRRLFQYSSLIMIILSIVLIGKAIHAFQESGYSSITQLPGGIRFPALGIFPTIETLLAQLIVLLAIIFIWKYLNRIPGKT